MFQCHPCYSNVIRLYCVVVSPTVTGVHNWHEGAGCRYQCEMRLSYQEPRLTLSYTLPRGAAEYRQNGLAVLTSVISLPEFYDCDCSTAADSGEMKATKWPPKQAADLQSQHCAAVTL